GADNVALVTQAYDYISQWISKGRDSIMTMVGDLAKDLTPDQLMQAAIQAGLKYITDNLVPKAVEFIATKFLVPAAGVLKSIYDTVNWVFNSLGKFQQL